MDEKASIGLKIHSGIEHGAWRLTISVVQRREGEGHPTNPSSHSDGARGMGLDDLVVTASISENYGDVYVDPPCYMSPWRVGERRARVMLATLTRCNKVIQKAEAREIGDVVTAFAKAIGATWYCETTEPSAAHRFYSDTQWTYTPINRARDVARHLIAEERANWAAKHPDRVKELAA